MRYFQNIALLLCFDLPVRQSSSTNEFLFRYTGQSYYIHRRFSFLLDFHTTLFSLGVSSIDLAKRFFSPGIFEFFNSLHLFEPRADWIRHTAEGYAWRGQWSAVSEDPLPSAHHWGTHPHSVSLLPDRTSSLLLFGSRGKRMAAPSVTNIYQTLNGTTCFAEGSSTPGRFSGRSHGLVPVKKAIFCRLFLVSKVCRIRGYIFRCYFRGS